MKSSLKEINGRYYMPAKVVMLTTNEKSNICFRNYLFLNKDNIGTYSNVEFKHLYVTSSEEIKVGDLVLMPDNTIHKMSPSDMIDYLDSQSKATRKIIASTDPTLGLPQPSQSFIKAYIKAYNSGNVITDVLVEYEKRMTDLILGKTITILKIDSDNTITIKKVKDSWSYEEHCVDMQYYMEYCERSGYVTPQEWLSKYKHY